MIQEIHIKNFKSIVDLKIELGLTNVFIGENGSGKSNVLEAIAMLSAAKKMNLSATGITSKGVRVTKPSLTFNSFKYNKNKEEIIFKIIDDNNEEEVKLFSKDPDDIFSEWEIKEDDQYRRMILDAINTTLEENSAEEILNKIKDSSERTFKRYNNEEGKKLIKDRYNSSLRERFLTELIKMSNNDDFKNNLLNTEISEFLIYSLNTLSLRGISNDSKVNPLGINGEGLDILISTFSKDEILKLKEFMSLISWFEGFMIDNDDNLKYKGHRLNRSNSQLYFKDKYMSTKNNIFAAENSNEGILHILFYFSLYISRRTPSFFAIDNIESTLNPKLCRELMKRITYLGKEYQKQSLITTHNPAVLDGLNLYDESLRLFVVKRNDNGHTILERIKIKTEEESNLKLSEMWMRGYLGGLPNF